MAFLSTTCPACVAQRKKTMDTFKAWWQQPFSADMDAVHWFLFFGLIVAISIVWGMALRGLQAATTE